MQSQTEKEKSEKLPELMELFPLMEKLGKHLKQNGTLNGVKIGWHCHLTQLTLLTAEALVEGGAQLFLSEVNPATTDDDAVNAIRALGAQVFVGESSAEKVLAESPQLLTDTGFVMIDKYLSMPQAERPKSVIAASEITTSGIEKLRMIKDLSLPVININGGLLKARIENYHGVGDGVVDLMRRLTGRSLAGLNSVVVGYGAVGSGVAYHLRKEGGIVNVVDSDPVRRLIAHFDGFSVNDLLTSLRNADVVVTATGKRQIIGETHWQAAKDGAIFLNVGHWPEELDMNALRKLATKVDDLELKTQRFHLHDVAGPDSEKRIYVVADGNPANIVLLTGSVEPTLIHLATEALCLSYLAKHGASLGHGEHLVPYEVEQNSSILALEALRA
jgi:adenosylhomocysteinase